MAIQFNILLYALYIIALAQVFQVSFHSFTAIPSDLCCSSRRLHRKSSNLTNMRFFPFIAMIQSASLDKPVVLHMNRKYCTWIESIVEKYRQFNRMTMFQSETHLSNLMYTSVVVNILARSIQTHKKRENRMEENITSFGVLKKWNILQG